MKIARALALALATSSATASPPNDPREFDAFSFYTQPGACTERELCIDGDITRYHKRWWFEVSLAELGLPEDTHAVFLQAMLNVTHPAADPSVCYLQAMVAGEPHEVDDRDDRQWTLRLMSHRSSERDSQFTIAFPVDGKLWLRYHFRGPGWYPRYCSYGLRISVAGWM